MLTVEGNRATPPPGCFGIITVEDGTAVWHHVSPGVPYCLVNHTRCGHAELSCDNCPLKGRGTVADLRFVPTGSACMNDTFGFNLNGEGIEVVRK
jgi:hypothetical protein